MFPLIFIPFAVFAGCVLGQFHYQRQVRQALASRHPEVWRDLSDRALFLDNAIFGFVFKKRDRDLRDPELSAICDRIRLLQILAFVAWGVYAVVFVAGVVTAES